MTEIYRVAAAEEADRLHTAAKLQTVVENLKPCDRRARRGAARDIQAHAVRRGAALFLACLGVGGVAKRIGEIRICYGVAHADVPDGAVLVGRELIAENGVAVVGRQVHVKILIVVIFQVIDSVLFLFCPG